MTDAVECVAQALYEKHCSFTTLDILVQGQPAKITAEVPWAMAPAWRQARCKEDARAVVAALRALDKPAI